jgi:WD40 repeat protein/DNA-binding XRE family transcriptional regulator
MGEKRRYKARDYAFGEQLHALRTRAKLLQAELAALLQVSQRSIHNWENGEAYPNEVHLRHLLALVQQRGLFTPGHEQQDAEQLWALVGQHTAKPLSPFDAAWFTSLPSPSSTVPPAEAAAVGTPGRPPRPTIVDWGEAPDTSGFHGRTAELATLHAWIGAERVRLVTLLGMGGIGKTSLAARLVRELAPSFEVIYWRSLRNIPPVEEWLAGAIGLLSEHQLVPPEGLEARLALLIDLLRKRRSLLILDNFETLLEPAAPALRYRAGSAGYGALLERLGTVDHAGCLLLTSREKPPELAPLEGGAARGLRLDGLDQTASRALLEDKHLVGDAAAWEALVTSYGGNALALKLVGETIVQLFDGLIASFLAVGVPVFGSITQLLATQLGRLSALELALLRWLAVARQGVRVGELATALEPPQSAPIVLEALEGVRNRSLVEPGERRGTFTLQPVVLEYLTEQLVEIVAGEILDGQPALLCGHTLIQATAPDYVRRTQEQLIGQPLLERLRAMGGADGAQEHLLRLLESWRDQAEGAGYGPGNVVNLLRLLRGHLRGLDLSRLAIRQAYLAEADAQDASLVDARLAETVLAEAFDFPGSVALSSDGALLATGTSTGEVWLWRVADRTPLMAVQGHTGAVWGVAISTDGQLLASGGGDGTVQLWEASSGRPLATLQGHTGAVWGVALSPDGQLLASGGEDGTVRLWEASSGRPLATLEGHTGRSYGVALSAEGGLLASGGEDGVVRLWEASSGRPLATFQGHAGTVWSVALSPDGQLLASGGEDRTVRLWEASAGQALATLEGHTAAIWSVGLSADGQLLASGSGDGIVRLWETGTGRPVATLQGHTGGVWRVALSADGQLLASGGGDGTVRLWEPSTGRPLTTLRGHTGTVWSVALSVDSHLLASGGTDGVVRLWEANSGRALATFEGHTSGVFGVAISADGQLLASSGEDGTVRLWETGTGRVLATLEGHTGGVRSVALSGDGQLLASGGTDGTVRLWESSSGRVLATLRGHVGGVWRVALSADSQLLASADGEGTVRLWERSTGQLLATLAGHTGTVWSVTLSADGRLLASGGGDGMIRLWEASTGQALAALEGHTSGVWGLALSADGRLLVSGGGDGTVRLWETGTGRPLATLQGHIGGVFSVAISADGELLVTGGFDGMIRLWEASTGSSLRTLRPERRYERVDITGLAGITSAQRTALIALGAAERPA